MLCFSRNCDNIISSALLSRPSIKTARSTFWYISCGVTAASCLAWWNEGTEEKDGAEGAEGAEERGDEADRIFKPDIE